MENQFTIIGADGRQYGPVSAEQIHRWIAEGRANAFTRVLPQGAAEWRPLGALPEFAGRFAPAVPPTIGPLSPGGVRRINSFAMWGMILGIVAFLCCCAKVLLGVLGIIFSLVGLSQINERPDIYEGRGMAIAGIVLSIVAILSAVLLLILALANGHFHYYWHFRRF